MSRRRWVTKPATCARKRPFPSERDAQLFANANGLRDRHAPYRCNVCEQFHLSSAGLSLARKKREARDRALAAVAACAPC